MDTHLYNAESSLQDEQHEDENQMIQSMIEGRKSGGGKVHGLDSAGPDAGGHNTRLSRIT
jgi:hypothetical protein